MQYITWVCGKFQVLAKKRNGQWRPCFSHDIVTGSYMGKKNVLNTDKKLHIVPLKSNSLFLKVNTLINIMGNHESIFEWMHPVLPGSEEEKTVGRIRLRTTDQSSRQEECYTVIYRSIKDILPKIQIQPVDFRPFYKGIYLHTTKIFWKTLQAASPTMNNYTYTLSAGEFDSLLTR